VPVTDRIERDSAPGTQGMNDFRHRAYGGPCPPSGKHRYVFKLYALDGKLGLREDASRQELEDAMKDHVVAEAEFYGVYEKS
jgi:hypothetical protein